MAIRTNFMLIDFINGDGDLSISATDLTNISKQIITTDNAVLYMKHKYGTRFYPVLRGSATADENDAYSDFCLDFRSWVNNRQHNIDKMYQALFDYDYSPIENVDRYETETIDRDIDTTYGKRNTLSGSDSLSMTGTVTNTGTDTTTETGTDTLANSGTDSTTKSGNIANEHEIAGMNSPNSYTNESKNTETYNNVKDKTDFGKTETNTKNLTNQETKNLTETYNRTDATTYGKIDTASGSDATNDDTLRSLRVHGNIGVTTNNQLIEQELEMRMMSLAEMLIDNFINDYTFYS